MRVALAAGLLITVTALAYGGAAAAENQNAEISSAAKAKSVNAKSAKATKSKVKPKPPVLAVRVRRPIPSGWRPADPSFDSKGRPYRPPPGLSCPIDLGYGRWASCNDEF